MTLKQRIPIGRIALESLFIVLAAAVALFANSWREERAAEERATEALAAIDAEMRANTEALRDAADYHATLQGRLVGHQGENAPSMSVFSRGFVAPANLSRHAWQSAANTGALEAAPYERILELESAYQEQARYEQQVDIISGEVYRLLFDGGTEGVRSSWRNLTAVIQALLYRECSLIATLEGRLEGSRAGPEDAASADLPAACSRLVRAPGAQDGSVQDD